MRKATPLIGTVLLLLLNEEASCFLQSPPAYRTRPLSSSAPSKLYVSSSSEPSMAMDESLRKQEIAQVMFLF